MDSVCYVYWIHRPNDTNMFAEGYVGITKDTTKRFKSHIKSSKTTKVKNHKFYNNLRKYDDYIFEVVLKSTRSYCLWLEKQLRPEKHIGLNHSAGGSYTPESKDINTSTKDKLRISAKLAYENDPTLIERCGKLNKGSVHTTEHKEKVSKALKNKGLAWKNSLANHSLWKNAESMYIYYLTGTCISYYNLSKHFGLKIHETKVIYNYFVAGWNPINDTDYQKYLKEN